MDGGRFFRIWQRLREINRRGARKLSPGRKSMPEKLNFGLYGEEGQLEPRRYSSGKTQVDLIKEIVRAFEDNDIVFLKGDRG